MNKLILAFGLTLAASSAALADSTALDAYRFPAQQGQVALSTDTGANIAQNRFGDASPAYNGGATNVDYRATAAIGGQAYGQDLGVSLRAQ